MTRTDRIATASTASAADQDAAGSLTQPAAQPAATGAAPSGRLAPLRDAVLASGPGRWFQSRSHRDQCMLIVLGAFLVLVTLWLGVWQPVQDGLAVAQGRHAAALADHRWMIENRSLAERAAAAQGEGSGRSGQALLSTVASSARQSGLTLNRFQPEGDDALAVSLDDVPFAELLLWLETLATREGIRVRQATIDGRDQPGRVRARLVLI